jgi:lipopolysaccharide export system protein LptA
MRKSEAAKYARASAALALVFAALTIGVYVKRGWTRRTERKNAPASAPVDVERQSSHIAFSKGEGTQKEFTVEASKSTDFRGLNASDLEGVKITIFGKDGARHDTMDTHACRYTKDTGDISCAGDVEIILMSAEQFKAAGESAAAAGSPQAPGTMKIETRGVSFNRANGEALTNASVKFSFANGNGEAVGAAYDSEQGTLRLQHDVKLQLQPPARSTNRGKPVPDREPVQVTGTRMDFSRDNGTVLLSGPASARTQHAQLTAAAILLELDANFRARRAIAKSDGVSTRPQFISSNGAATQTLSAQEITAAFTPEGWITQAAATGGIQGESRANGQLQTVNAQGAEMRMSSAQNNPKSLVFKGDVLAKMNSAAPAQSNSSAVNERELSTEELQLGFAEKTAGKTSKRGVRLASAVSPGAGKLQLNDLDAQTGKPTRTSVQGDHLSMQFDTAGKASRLDVKGNTATERTSAGSEKQMATAQNGSIELSPFGGWSRINLTENVHLVQGTRAAQAGHAEFDHTGQTVTLTDNATVRDTSTLTSAKKLTLWQSTNEIRGEGGVRSSDLSASTSSVHLAQAAAHISADLLDANSKTGRALYSGHARLWQGPSVLEADSIELLKTEKILNALGNVRAVFPQSPNQPTQADTGSKSSRHANVLWHTQSEKLTYWDPENRAHLEQNVTVQSAEQKIAGNALDLYFTKATNARNFSNPASPANPITSSGTQQIDKAIATGGVTVQQGDRRATADRGEYTSTDGKFVMSGGTPTLFDATQGTTIGRQLTFFLADATIIVDSENGSRTLTKHRVEK